MTRKTLPWSVASSAGVVAMLLLSAVAAADNFSWTAVAEAVVSALEQAIPASAAGDSDAARQAVLGAYFGVFEDRKMEAAMRKELGQEHTVAVEARFNDLRKAVGAKTSASVVADQVAALSQILREDARQLDARGVPEQVYVGR